ncbi:ABC transporter ATP-binding protein [Pseudenhygromyxa sp. WMMC2535]|uniref:ABC transporter ATP-binding protein n=1 Tax=Pseudenhygromyxa sp. WMMC2535 TaxID=2712867 RepID=UPI001553D0E8|nr:ABC transporter ATP-binding protein [Pseudenhygromyxa sp. WMMC2535]NVB40509.1 ABC transporter ATP-binding protein [Pseudenhygromyxa sp. WMMC2535]
MIRLRGVRKRYTTKKVVNEVLRGVDLEIDPGEFVAIVGRSGSGKTTMLNILGALDSDYEGEVEVDGKRLRALGDVEISDYRNQNIGFVFQSFHLLEHMTCLENVSLPAVFARGREVLDARAAEARAREVLAQVELSDKCDAMPFTLSGGQKQRVAIARALFNRPKLMICDEPTGNLDSSTAHAILDLFRKLNEEQGITLVIVTHDAMISQACKRVVRIHDGSIVEGAGEFGSRSLTETPKSSSAWQPVSGPEFVASGQGSRGANS